MDISPISQSFVAYPVSFANPSTGEESPLPGLKQADEDENKNKSSELNKAETDANNQDSKGNQDGKELTPKETREVEELEARDAEVRAHEMAHLAAAGGLAVSGANFTYERGPDGGSYAVAGEVKIDTSKGKDPEETLRRAQTIQTAALAPVEPSATDRKVAAEAARMETEARAEIAELDEQENLEAAEATQEKEEAEEKDKSSKHANTADFPLSHQPPAIKQYQAIFQNQPAANNGFHLAV